MSDLEGGLHFAAFEAYPSPIDTRYFGIASAKVLLKRPVEDEQQQEALRKYMDGFAFVIISNSDSSPVNDRWLGEKTSAFLVDVNVQLRKELSGQPAPAVDGTAYTVTVSDHLPPDPQIVRIAEEDFQLSQFRNDPYLPQDKARRIYGDIVQNAFQKLGRFFVVARAAERVAGFLLFSQNTATASATIQLIVVNPAFQRQGVGQTLVRAMESAVFAQGIREILVGTQFNNFSALGFYYRSGFQLFSGSSIYHYWPQRGAVMETSPHTESAV